MNIGDLLTQMKRFPEAVASFERLIKDFPESLSLDRALMKIAASGSSAASLAAAAIAVASPWSLGWLSAGTSVTALEGVAFAGGAIQSAMLIAFGSLVIELAPPGRRHAFVGLMNTFLGATMLLPIVGGALVDGFNVPTVFALWVVGLGVRWHWNDAGCGADVSVSPEIPRRAHEGGHAVFDQAVPPREECRGRLQ